MLHDTLTGKLRLTFKNLVAAAKLTVREGDKDDPCLIRFTIPEVEVGLTV